MPSSLASRALFAGMAALALGLAACSGDTTNPGGGGGLPGGGTGGNGSGSNGGLTQAQINSIGAAAVDELNESATALLSLDYLADPFASTALGASGAAFATPPNLPAGCATLDPANPANPDGDKIPTDVTVTFDKAKCVRTGPNGLSGQLFGSAHVVDPNPDAAGRDYDMTFTGLGWTITRPDSGSRTVTRDGRRILTSSDTKISHADTMTITREHSGEELVTVERKGAATFTADAGQTISSDQPRPSGTITIDGSLTWTQGSTTVSFATVTVTPLHYDASCTSVQPFQRFTAGELHYNRLDTGAGDGYYKLVFKGCGVAPEQSFVPAS